MLNCEAFYQLPVDLLVNKTPKGVNAGGDFVTLRYGSISHTRNSFATI